jgi:thioesterase domain-containing protein
MQQCFVNGGSGGSVKTSSDSLQARHRLLAIHCRSSVMISDLVIQNGRTPGPLIFCIPGAGDTVASFLPLAGALGPNLTLYGLQPDFSRMCASRSHDDVIHVAASDSVNIIRRRATADWYVLVAHSYGGWIAFESALRLDQVGHPPSAVILLDTDPPGNDRQITYTRSDAFVEYLHLLDMVSRPAHGSICSPPSDLPPDRQSEWLRNEMVRTSLIPKGTSTTLIDDQLRAIQLSLNTTYIPSTPLALPVWLVQPQTLFKSCNGHRQVTPQVAPDIAFGCWISYATNLKRVPTTGNHVSLLREPHISAIADVVRTVCLWSNAGSHCS